MALYLFAGIPVSDYAAGLAWYETLMGQPPAFIPNNHEAVWELAEHRYFYIELRPEFAGHAMVTVLVERLDERLAEMAQRGLEPFRREDYDNGVRKIIFRDPEGNEIGFGDSPE